MPATDTERLAMIHCEWSALALGLVGGGGGAHIIGSGVVGGLPDMSTLKPGDAYSGQFTTQSFETGAATDADSLPVATATRNGADDGSFVLTVAKLDTGRYKVTGTVPAGYAAGDVVRVSVAATVDGVAGKGIVDGFVVDTARASEIKAKTDGLNFTGSDVNATLDGETVAVGDKTGFALTAAYDSSKTAAQAGDAMTLTAAYNAAKTAAQAGDEMALTTSLTSMLSTCQAFAKGKVTISGSAWTFYAADGVTPLFTLTVSTTGRTVA